MSTDTLPSMGETAEHVANDPGMGGTEPEGDVRADGNEVESKGEEVQNETAEGAEPKAEEPKAEEAEAPLQSAEDRSSIEQANYIASVVAGHPDRVKMLQEWAAKDRGESGPQDLMTMTERAASEHFPRQEDQSALKAVLKPYADEIASLRREIAAMRPRVDRADQMSVTGIFSQTLTRNGVVNGLADKQFLRHLSELRQDPEFQRDERSRPAYAAKFAAATWKAKSAARSGNVAKQQQVERAKGGQLHGAAGVNGNGVSKVYEIDDSKPGWDREHFSILLKNPNAKIVLKSEKK